MVKINWFKRKTYGWGWVPSSWEGWLVTAIFVIYIISISIRYENGLLAPEFFSYRLLLSTAIMVMIAYKTGPKPEWRWG